MGTIRKQILGWAFCVAACVLSCAAQTTVTTSGGSANTVPMFVGPATGDSSIANSPITVSNSNVGIGVAGAYPLGVLDVKGATNQHVVILANDNGNDLGVPGIVSIADGGTSYEPLGFYATSYYFGMGNVGIGTTTANGTLDVERFQSDNGVILQLGNYYSGVSFQFSRSPTTGALSLQGTQTGNNNIVLAPTSGNVGIGTTSPAGLLSVGASNQFQVSTVGAVTAPSVTFTGANGGTQTTPWTGVLCGGDYAEAVNAKGSLKTYEPGDVLVIGDGAGGEVQKSTDPYSTMVAGIYATKPGVIGRRQSLLKEDEELPMAMIGIVPTKVTTENGPIHRGDLLVTSSTIGYAMKGTDRSRLVGAVIGKAMGSLESGTGVVEVLVTLQ